MKKSPLLFIFGTFIFFAADMKLCFSQIPAPDPYAEGVSLLKAKQYAAALPLLEKAVEKNPNASSYYQLGYCQYLLGKVKEADANFILSDRRHSSPSLHDYAGELFGKLSENDQKWVLAAILEVPDFPVVISKTGNPAADYNWRCKTLDGKKFDMAQLKGKTVFLNFWATWCGPCVAEMPGLDRFYQKMKNEPVVFLFIANEETQKVKQFIEERKFSLPIYLGREVPRVFMPDDGIPCTFIVSSKGQVVYKVVGLEKWDDPKCVEFLKKVVKEGAL